MAQDRLEPACLRHGVILPRCLSIGAVREGDVSVKTDILTAVWLWTRESRRPAPLLARASVRHVDRPLELRHTPDCGWLQRILETVALRRARLAKGVRHAYPFQADHADLLNPLAPPSASAAAVMIVARESSARAAVVATISMSASVLHGHLRSGLPE
jgi:hypothetical protein